MLLSTECSCGIVSAKRDLAHHYKISSTNVWLIKFSVLQLHDRFSDSQSVRITVQRTFQISTTKKKKKSACARFLFMETIPCTVYIAGLHVSTATDTVFHMNLFS